MATKYTQKQVIEAIQGSRGIIAAVARRLGCTRATVYNYVERHEKVAQALEDERESLLDLAEGTLYEKAIKEKDTTSLIFLLKTIGKRRGYVERYEQEHSGELPVIVVKREE